MISPRAHSGTCTVDAEPSLLIVLEWGYAVRFPVRTPLRTLLAEKASWGTSAPLVLDRVPTVPCGGPASEGSAGAERHLSCGNFALVRFASDARNDSCSTRADE